MNNWQMEFESQFLLLIKILNSHIIHSSTMKEFNVHLNTIPGVWQKLSELQKFEVGEF